MPSGFLYDMQAAESYTLNAAGLCVVRALAEQRDLGQIWRHIVDQFDVTEEQARRDAPRFLAELRSLGLLAGEAHPEDRPA
jgi:hypothetical protein